MTSQLNLGPEELYPSLLKITKTFDITYVVNFRYFIDSKNAYKKFRTYIIFKDFNA